MLEKDADPLDHMGANLAAATPPDLPLTSIKHRSLPPPDGVTEELDIIAPVAGIGELWKTVKTQLYRAISRFSQVNLVVLQKLPRILNLARLLSRYRIVIETDRKMVAGTGWGFYSYDRNSVDRT